MRSSYVSDNDHKNKESLEIEIFTVKKEIYKITFSSIESYRVTNESFLFSGKYDIGGEINRSAMYVTQDSEYITWLKNVSNNIYDENIFKNIKHFLIFTNEEVIEIISNDEPLVA